MTDMQMRVAISGIINFIEFTDMNSMLWTPWIFHIVHSQWQASYSSKHIPHPRIMKNTHRSKLSPLPPNNLTWMSLFTYNIFHTLYWIVQAGNKWKKNTFQQCVPASFSLVSHPHIAACFAVTNTFLHEGELQTGLRNRRTASQHLIFSHEVSCTCTIQYQLEILKKSLLYWMVKIASFFIENIAKMDLNIKNGSYR